MTTRPQEDRWIDMAGVGPVRLRHRHHRHRLRAVAVHPDSTQIDTAPALLVFAALAQLIAAMWAFRRNNTSPATAYSVYAATATSIVYGRALLPVFGKA